MEGRQWGLSFVSIRLHTGAGRPLSSDRFVSKVEFLVGRRLRRLPVGRPQTASKRKPKARSQNR